MTDEGRNSGEGREVWRRLAEINAGFNGEKGGKSAERDEGERLVIAALLDLHQRVGPTLHDLRSGPKETHG